MRSNTRPRSRGAILLHAGKAPLAAATARPGPDGGTVVGAGEEPSGCTSRPGTIVREGPERAKAAGVSAEPRIIDASIAGAPDLFGRIARRFDLAVVGQARREHGATEELLIEGPLFHSGRPVIIDPVIAHRYAG